MQEVYGVVSVHDNSFAHNRGSALQWTNSAREDEEALIPELLLFVVNLFLNTQLTNTQLPNMEQASLQGNSFETVATNALPLFRLLNLRQVSVSGNSCYGEAMAGALGEVENISRGLIANNQLQSGGEVGVAVRKMLTGVVHGNVGNVAIELSLSSSERGMNIPDARVL